MEIRQSLKAVKAGYILCLVLELVLIALYEAGEFPSTVPFLAIGLLPVFLAIFVAIRHIHRRMTKITISTDRVHFEQGLLSKTTRTVELAKVQDVRVNQSMWQRIFNVGNMSLETAGSASRILMDSIDRPQEVANHVLDMAHAAGRLAQSQMIQGGPQNPAGTPQGGQQGGAKSGAFGGGL